MRTITHQVVGTGHTAQCHDSVSDAVMALAMRITAHLERNEDGAENSHWVNVSFSSDGVTDDVITISKDE